MTKMMPFRHFLQHFGFTSSQDVYIGLPQMVLPTSFLEFFITPSTDYTRIQVHDFHAM